ncbi:phenylalanyl-tRNA synthetase subunit beta [Anopheles sinensis]|uniref:Phenylalanyl-tRNA synthetase subunit beta n=1 Tax=Anopheles sinensis TaxID=74873 RepID=A0A084WUN3_ANOSI|nr:phenylalanyl-tRNA synthetase subunit beta [Anopheles sinensis]
MSRSLAVVNGGRESDPKLVHFPPGTSAQSWCVIIHPRCPKTERSPLVGVFVIVFLSPSHSHSCSKIKGRPDGRWRRRGFICQLRQNGTDTRSCQIELPDRAAAIRMRSAGSDVGIGAIETIYLAHLFVDPIGSDTRWR